MFESLFTITIYLSAVFIPVLIPTTVQAVHFVRDGRLTFRPRLGAALRRRFSRPVVARRVATPATA